MDSVLISNTRIDLFLGDITTLDVDAVVNAANTQLAGGGGVDGAIHRAAGRTLNEECRKIIAERGRLPTGQAVATGAGDMIARHIIHTVGPIYHDGAHGEPDLLRSAYRSSMAVADSLGLESIAFPAVSTGVYGYPAAQASKVAVDAVVEYLTANPESRLRQVIFVLFDSGGYALYKDLFSTGFGKMG